jgi:hypothetical protein
MTITLQNAMLKNFFLNVKYTFAFPCRLNIDLGNIIVILEKNEIPIYEEQRCFKNKKKIFHLHNQNSIYLCNPNKNNIL